MYKQKPRQFWRTININRCTNNDIFVIFQDPLTREPVPIAQNPDFLNRYYAEMGASEPTKVTRDLYPESGRHFINSVRKLCS